MIIQPTLKINFKFSARPDGEYPAGRKKYQCNPESKSENRDEITFEFSLYLAPKF
jgi:hypothetical protein